jgi:predicted nucleic acid-binding protein
VSAVISDASSLINLARAEQFQLLAIFYGQIVIPQAVYDEVVTRGERRDRLTCGKPVAFDKMREVTTAAEMVGKTCLRAVFSL